MYEYSAKMLRVVDGETLDLNVDLGFHTTIVERFRLAGIAAAEGAGSAAADYLRKRLPPGTRVRIVSKKQDKWRRWLATVFVADDSASINTQLVVAGLASFYQL